MTDLSGVRRKYGLPEGAKVEVFDYATVPTEELLRKVEELERRLRGGEDASLEDAAGANELAALKMEMDRRLREKETVVPLSRGFAKVLTPARIELIAAIRRADGFSSIKELSEKVGRPEKSVVRDLKILERHGLVTTRDVIDERGRRKAVAAGAQKIILVA